MFSTASLLSILKVISEGLTAGFGIFGVLNEDADDNAKKARKRKIAVAGIIASFVASGVIAIVENANKRAEERAHEKEIRRLSTPIGNDIRAEVFFSFGPELFTSVRAESQLRKFFEEKASKHQDARDDDAEEGVSISRGAHGRIAGIDVKHNVLPPSLRTVHSDLLDAFDWPSMCRVQLYRTAHCADLLSIA